MNRAIADKLLALRKQHGMSREDLAERIGVSYETVAGWENSDISPDMDNLVALAGMYNISLDRLLDINVRPEEQRSAVSLEKTKYAEQQDIGSYFKYETADEGGLPAQISENGVSEKGAFSREYSDIILRIQNDKKFYKKLMKFPYPLFATGAFLASGAFLNLWHPMWMLFLTIPLYYTTIQAIKKKNLNIFCFPVLVTLLYLIAGFALDLWHPGWISFLSIPVYYWVINTMKDEKEDDKRKLQGDQNEL